MTETKLGVDRKIPVLYNKYHDMLCYAEVTVKIRNSCRQSRIRYRRRRQMRKNKMWRKRALALAVGVSMVLAGAPARVSRGADAEKVYAAAYQNASSVAETTDRKSVV